MRHRRRTRGRSRQRGQVGHGHDCFRSWSWLPRIVVFVLQNLRSSKVRFVSRSGTPRSPCHARSAIVGVASVPSPATPRCSFRPIGRCARHVRPSFCRPGRRRQPRDSRPGRLQRWHAAYAPPVVPRVFTGSELEVARVVALAAEAVPAGMPCRQAPRPRRSGDAWLPTAWRPRSDPGRLTCLSWSISQLALHS